jgi:hypothetical protein
LFSSRHSILEIVSAKTGVIEQTCVDFSYTHSLVKSNAPKILVLINNLQASDSTGVDLAALNAFSPMTRNNNEERI